MTVLNDSPDADEDLERAAERQRQLLTELKSARAESLDALERATATSDLQRAAGRLGRALQSTADNAGLWRSLAASSGQLQSLTGTQREELGRLIQIDWDIVLDRVGYEPPPTSELIARDLHVAVDEARRTGSGTDVGKTIERVRGLADTLLALADAAEPDGRALRKWLRRGVRMAGKLTIALGLTAALGIGAASAAASVIPAVLGSGAAAAVGKVVVDEILDTVKSGLGTWLNGWLDRILPAPDKAAPVSERDPADLEASDAMKVDMAEVGALQSDLRFLAAADFAPEGSAKVAGRIELRADHIASALVRCWDAAVGAPWATGRFFAMTQAVSDDLRSIRTGLAVFPNGHGPSLSAAGNGLNEHVQALNDFFKVHVGHSHDGSREA